jgi:hypothetical protein
VTAELAPHETAVTFSRNQRGRKRTRLHALLGAPFSRLLELALNERHQQLGISFFFHLHFFRILPRLVAICIELRVCRVRERRCCDSFRRTGYVRTVITSYVTSAIGRVYLWSDEIRAGTASFSNS